MAANFLKLEDMGANKTLDGVHELLTQLNIDRKELEAFLAEQNN